MTRAWAIFRETYRYQAIKFTRIGRPCFAWALKKAWAEARAAADLAATPTEVIQARVERISQELDELKYRSWGTDLAREHNRLNDELRPLAKESLRRPLAASLDLVRAQADALPLAA
jgi:hypothetical protein